MVKQNGKKVATALDGPRVIAEMEPGRVFDVGMLSNLLSLRIGSLRVLLDELVSSGDIEKGVFLTAAGVRCAGYFRITESIPLCAFDEDRRVVDVTPRKILALMKSSAGYRASEIAMRHGVSSKRATELLASLVAAGHVVAVSIVAQGRRLDTYYVGGTQPVAKSAGESTSTPARTARPLSEQSVYDADYARALMSLRNIAAAARGRS
ncbi:hypothetical protein [Burkholderia cenocepacia]|uniref:hypothetical protein n=1 Tax=Burkholderia cenocepacia TaxID=95486 RepID=UPI000F5C0E0C|nr:hypothetical protein [Burkholderia cenocepacia]